MKEILKKLSTFFIFFLIFLRILGYGWDWGMGDWGIGALDSYISSIFFLIDLFNSEINSE